ncbi:hypothetical protein BC629DRAFT_1594060 [Irpex lacteus]|nr:hypothetical protein BC629DRAFT_1594060 [Irpex lacteus]
MSYFPAAWSLDDPRQRAPASTLPTTHVPPITSPSPNSNNLCEENSEPFMPDPALPHVYTPYPTYLGPPSAHTSHQFHSSFTEHTISHAPGVWTSSSILPSETAQNTNWYQSAMGSLPFDNTMSSGPGHAALDMPPAPQYFVDAVEDTLPLAEFQYAHTYYEAQHRFAYVGILFVSCTFMMPTTFPQDSPSFPSSIQPLVTGQSGGSPISNDNAPSYPIHKDSDPLICDLCGKGPFGRIYELRRHKATVHAPPTQRFLCAFCQSPFKRDDDRKRHVRTQHEGK